MNDPRDWNNHSRWEAAVSLAERMVARGDFRAVAFQAYEDGFSPCVRLGTQRDGQPLDGNSLFLVASLTKPVVALTVLDLVQEGILSLNERICDLLPEWNTNEKRRITVRHLLSHTSGLPDQLPNNQELRARGASLEEFYQHILSTPLDFAPGSRVQYQSMGFVVLGELVRRLTGEDLGTAVRKRIFEPLGMTNSYLGLADHPEAESILARVTSVELDAEQAATAGNWNSAYWQSLGAPWGGMLSTPVDMLTFCASHFRAGLGKSRFLPYPVLTEAMVNQLPFLEDMNPRDRTCRPWGLGWRLNWAGHRETFGDFLSEYAVGHWGATGSLMWLDDRWERACVLCCSRPTSESRIPLIRLSNAIHSAMESDD